jgi:hypothetical protein
VDPAGDAMRSLLTRLNRLEKVQAIEQGYRPLKLEIGYLKELPAEYTGPRHTGTVGQLPDEHYLWEEQAGSAPPVRMMQMTGMLCGSSWWKLRTGGPYRSRVSMSLNRKTDADIAPYRSRPL